MNLLRATIFLLLSSAGVVTAMDCPLRVLLEENTEIHEKGMLTWVKSAQDAHELLDVSKQMLIQYTQLDAHVKDAEPLHIAATQLTMIELPTAAKWQQQTIPVIRKLGDFIFGSYRLQHTFDQKLAADSNATTHANAITLRKYLTNELIQKNEEYKSLKNELFTQFQPHIVSQCTCPQSIEYIKNVINKKSDDDDKLFILVKLAHRFTKFEVANRNFITSVANIQKHLRINPEKNESLNTREQIIDFCLQKSITIQKKLQKKYRDEQKQLNSSMQTFELAPKKSLPHIENIVALNQAYLQDSATFIQELEEYHDFLRPTFISSLKKNVAHYQALSPKLTKLLEPCGSKKESAPTALEPVCTITNISHIPVSQLGILPCTVAKMKNLKSEYSQFIQFRLKSPLCNSNDKDAAEILYFLSKGTYLDQKTAQEQLHPTTHFLFTSCNEMRMVEQDTNTKNTSNTLWYHPNGTYYFIDHTLPEPQAFQVDRVAALCFSNQQPTQSKIEPQMRNSADNKK